MTLKTIFIMAFAILWDITALQAQKTNGDAPVPAVLPNQSKAVTMTVQPWKGSGIPEGWKPKPGPTEIHVHPGGSSSPRNGSPVGAGNPKGETNPNGTAKSHLKGSDPSQTIDPKILEQDRLRNIERLRIHDSIQKAKEKPLNSVR